LIKTVMKLSYNMYTQNGLCTVWHKEGNFWKTQQKWKKSKKKLLLTEI